MGPEEDTIGNSLIACISPKNRVPWIGVLKRLRKRKAIIGDRAQLRKVGVQDIMNIWEVAAISMAIPPIEYGKRAQGTTVDKPAAIYSWDAVQPASYK